MGIVGTQINPGEYYHNINGQKGEEELRGKKY